jgi:copper chaperone CopZ
MGRRTTFIYLATVAVSAIASGLILDYIFNLGNFTPSPGMPWMMPGFARTTFALILLAVLAAGFYKPTLKGVKALPESNIKERITLVIKGMTCSHCAQSVQQALLGAPGVGAVEIDLNSGKAVVGGNKLDIDRMRKAIEGAGFQLMSWDGPSGGKASG